MKHFPKIIAFSLIAAFASGPTWASGDVYGAVTSAADSAPIGDVEVSLLQPSGDGWSLRSYTSTETDGSYSFDAVPDGRYRLQFRDWSQQFAYQYNGGVSTPDAAVDVLISGNNAEVNAELAPAGRIAGSFLAANGQPIDNGFVAVFEDRQPLGDVLFIDVLGPADASYDIGGLPTGQYIARFSGAVNGSQHLEYFANVPDPWLATPISVIEGETTSLDIELGDLAGYALTGVLTNADATALPGIEVSIYREVNGQWQYESFVYTDAAGSYRFDDLFPREYKVLFRDWSGNYAYQYWPDAGTLDTASTLTVTDADVTANMVLPVAGRIQGRLDDPAGRPLQNPLVAVYPADDPTADVLFIDQPINGDYDIGGLPNGEYVVRFSGQQCNNRSYLQFYQNAPSYELATPVAVAVGATTENINGQLGLAPGGTIEGRIRDPYGRALDYATVTALQLIDGDVVEVSSVEATYLDDDYDYLLDVPSGTFVLQVSGGSYLAPNNTPIVEFFSNQSTVDAANEIEVQLDDRLTGIDIVLGDLSTGSISGQVTDSNGQAIEGIEVIPFDRSLAPLWDQIEITDNSGFYQLEGLWPETYFVRFYDPAGQHQNTYYGDSQTPGSATTVGVVGAVTGIDISLPPAPAEPPASIAGSVSNTPGFPVRGVTVTALQAPCDDSHGYPNCQAVSHAVSDNDGQYRIRDLPAGDYYVEFTDRANFLPEYFDDTAQLIDAQVINVTAGQEVTAIDAELTAAGAISGTVTNPFGRPFPILGVTAFSNLTGQWLPVASSGGINDATYRIEGLAEGVYRLGFSATSFGGLTLGREFYDDVQSIELATDIVVIGGETTAHIDAVLGETPPGAIAGLVTDANGAALSGIRVSLYDEYGFSDDLFTDDAGEYRFEPLFNGVYFIGFEDTGGTLSPEFYLDVASLDRATPIVVDDAAVESIDAVMDGANSTVGGGLISGRVTDFTGQPQPDIRVRCQSFDSDGPGFPDLPCSGLTDANGEYLIGGNLLTGDYLVEFVDPQGTYAKEYFDGATTSDNASPVFAQPGSITEAIDASLEIGAGVSGTVTRDSGGFYEITVVTLYQFDVDLGQWRFVASDSRLNDGNYEILGVPEGTYRLGFFGSGVSSILNPDREFFENAESIELATDLTLDGGQILTNINAVLGDLGQDNVINATFDQSIAGWSFGNPLTASHSSIDAFSDPNSGSLQILGSANTVSQCIAMPQHDELAFEALVKISDGSDAVVPSLSVLVDSFAASGCTGTPMHSQSLLTVGDSSDEWQRIRGALAASTEASALRLQFVIENVASDAQVLIDRINLTGSSALLKSGFESTDSQ